MPSHWKILACDLDGTLIGWNRTINERDLDALRRARAAGIHVAICTGRNARESARIIHGLELTGLGVFVNGAMVCDMATGTAAHSQVIQDTLVDEAVHFFGTRGHAVLILADDRASRLPAYYTTNHGPPHRATTDWLLSNRVTSLTVDQIPAEARGRIVRIGIVVDPHESALLHMDLEKQFAGRATSHSIYSPHYDCQILEFFQFGANKWSGIIHMAQAMHTGLDQVVTIGDDTNDLPMLVDAQLSFAMGDAKESIKAHAHRVTGTHADCGVAQVVDLLLAGELEPGAESGLMTPI